MKFCARILLCGFTLAVTGCTQSPAPVEYKGSGYYGRERETAIDSSASETYPSSSPRYKPEYTHPVEQAAVPTVAEADLPPPTVNRAAPPPAPYTPPQQAQPPVNQVTAGTVIATAPVATPLYSRAAPTVQRGRFIWPVSGGKIISRFGPKPDGSINDGINIAVAEGEPVYAAADGMVVYAGNELKGYGNMIILRHDNGWMTAYAHTRSISVKKNDYVKQNELIGYVGMTGGVKAPQLHFAIRNGKTPVDPEKYLPAGY